MVTQTINLNLVPGGVSPVINVSQYDIGNNGLIFKLYNGSEEFKIPPAASVALTGTKPDTTGFVYSAESFSGNAVNVNVTQQMTALAGDVTCELRIRQTVSESGNSDTGFSDHENIGTLNFILRVERAALTDETVLSETEIPLIEKAVDIAANLNEYIQETKAAAQTATNMAETATDAMKSASQSEINAKKYNDNVEQLSGGLSEATKAANTAASNAQSVADAVQKKLDSGELVGPQGQKGDTGESGIVAQASGMVTFAYDPTDGHLYAYSSENVAGSYQYDEADGHLYYVTEG